MNSACAIPVGLIKKRFLFGEGRGLRFGDECLDPGPQITSSGHILSRSLSPSLPSSLPPSLPQLCLPLSWLQSQQIVPLRWKRDSHQQFWASIHQLSSHSRTYVSLTQEFQQKSHNGFSLAWHGSQWGSLILGLLMCHEFQTPHGLQVGEGGHPKEN